MKKNGKNLLAFVILAGGLLLARFVFAQDFGTEAVNNGLAGSLSAADPRTIAGRIINIALGFLGIVAVGFIVYGGFIWMTSAGEEEKVEQAKKILKNGIIGLVIILASWGIATFILSRLSGAMNGDNGGYSDGSTASCGCGGSMVYSGGSWSGCIGSNCAGGGLSPTSCDSSSEPGCQAVNQICSAEDYCDNNDCGCKPKGSSGDSCDADLNNATCDADNNRCGEYLTCQPTTCVCFGPPVITEVSPVGGLCDENKNKSCVKDSDCATTCKLGIPNGAVNNFITILGKNFGEYSATSSRVVFNAAGNPVAGLQPAEINPDCINTWRDNQIIIAVPTGVSTGPIQVINKDNLADTTSNDYGPKIPDFQVNSIVRPGLCYLNPNSGVLSSEVSYKGINLYSGAAYFGNYQSNVRGLESKFVEPAGLGGTAMTPNIRSGASGSFVENKVSGQAEKSNFLQFTKEQEPGEGPYISSFAPTAGNAGQYVTLRGSGFGGARGLNKVYFGETEASYDFPDMCLNSVWKDDQIIVKVPAGLVDGYQIIKVQLASEVIDTQKLNPNTFQSDKNLDLKSSLCKIEPTGGPAATPVTLWGEYFGRTDDEGLIKFNYDKSATGTIKIENQANTIKTAVPTGAITGPVRVVNNNNWGNELNFAIGECAVDADCGTQVCCPQNTYRQGRCVGALADCFINIPTSVFEWSFSTGFGTSTPNPYAYSCSGLSKYYGTCQTGATCPNVPGTCSPYAGGGQKVVGACDFSCLSVAGCNGLGANNCSYDSSIDKCVKNGEGASCALPQAIDYVIGTATSTATRICNKDKHWEINVTTSCPTGWVRASGNKCVDNASNCSVCAAEFSCEKIGEEGRCVSKELCPGAGTCADNPTLNEEDRCVVPDKASCDCCCTIGQDARDCCSPLKCEGTCGTDKGKTSGVTLGRCGGCKLAGNTPEERDAACNCSGHGGQFCDISDPEFPNGYCTDCSNLSPTDCSSHSSACCLDSRKTSATTDDICRGGDGRLITNSPGDSGYGYCAYYNCSITEPDKCATSTPSMGDSSSYASQETCVNDCAVSNPCTEVTTLGECQEHPRCCFDSEIIGTAKCRLGNKIVGGAQDGECSSGADSCAGLAKYYGTCQTGATCPNVPGTCSPYPGGAKPATCDCCCTIGQDARDCCSPLKCEGTCGADASTTDGENGTNSGLGRCGGCKLAGNTPEERDAACNCSGHSGQFCDISSSQFPNGYCTDCSGLDQQACAEHSGVCCLNSQGTATTADDTCRGGAGDGSGYCADSPGGPGLSCLKETSSVCDSSICNFPGFGCLLDSGSLGTLPPDCGICCCQPGAATDACAAINAKLKCIADKGSCSGASRGLCCGCSKDEECGSAQTVGCGADSCCQARPEIVSTSPAHLAANVCRNAVIKVTFNSDMDTTSLAANTLLIEERDYGNGVCPAGTFIAAEDSLRELLAAKNKNWLARLAGNFKTVFVRLSRSFSGSAMADIPSPSKLYCAVPGTVTAENNGNNTSLFFSPQKLLAGTTSYYLAVLGDSDLNSQAGVLSSEEIGFNGLGYFDPTAAGGTGAYVEGELIKFNERSYKNSQIIKFTTLSDQGSMAGICAIDRVEIDPSSYLFPTAVNSLTENDGDSADRTFDTVADKDKVFTAWTYSADNQILQPVTGYAWNWNWQIGDSNIAERNSVAGLPFNKTIVSAKDKISDGETKLTATVDMSAFSDTNAYSGGDGFNHSANIYVFICSNPWPPVASSGEWAPWTDTCQGSIGGNCADYNYKFYYCRDAGSSNTLDDLPAIVNQAVIRGTSGNLICAADRTPCTSVGAACGPDKNGDGIKDGLCVWNILKESYFFREALLSGGEITAAVDQGTDGSVGIDWRSSASQVSSYKIYYLKSGQGTMLVKEVKPNDMVGGTKICTLTGTIYNCHTVISGLANDVPYVFKVSVISVNKTESQLSEEKTATPTDKTPPSAPAGLSFSVADSLLKFVWTPAPEASFYRLYHGITTGSYGESFDSEISASGLSFPPNQYSVGKHYFALTAVDKNNNESSKSVELTCNITTKEGCKDLESADCVDLNCCLPDCVGKCGGINSNNNCGRCDGLVGCTADKPDCNQSTGLCYKPCVPSCAGKCSGGTDGCGGTCPNPCAGGDICLNGNCCRSSCVGKCGGETDGCGGTCPNPCDNNHICSGGNCLSKIASLRVSVDDFHNTDFNGKLVGYGSDWRLVFQTNISLQSGKNVLVIAAQDAGGYYGISADLIGPGVNMNTNSVSGWKCQESSKVSGNYFTINYDDSAWPAPITFTGVGTSLPYNQIWTSDSSHPGSSPHSDQAVYCRYTFSLP